MRAATVVNVGRGTLVKSGENPATQLAAFASKRQRRAHLVERDRGWTRRQEFEVVDQAALERDLRRARQYLGRDTVERRRSRALCAVAECGHGLTPAAPSLGLIGQSGKRCESFDGIRTSAHGGKLGLYEQIRNAMGKCASARRGL
jgi:hypothetical protein